MEIYYWKLQTTGKLTLKMIGGGNLLWETPDSMQTNFQYNQRGSRCLWHHWFNTLVRRRPFSMLFAFRVWRQTSLFCIGNTEIFRAIIAYWDSVISSLMQCLNRTSLSHLTCKRQLFLDIFYQMQRENNCERLNCNISYILILETGK